MLLLLLLCCCCCCVVVVVVVGGYLWMRGGYSQRQVSALEGLSIRLGWKALYDKQVVDKKIMILGNDLSLYQKNKLAGYFLDWELSRKYFSQPDYYQNIILINRSIANDPPDVIIDESDLMGPVLERIPLLEKEYKREGNIYRRR